MRIKKIYKNMEEENYEEDDGRGEELEDKQEDDG